MKRLSYIEDARCLKVKLNHVQYNFTYPDSGYPDRLGSSGKFVDNFTKVIRFEITGYLVKHITALWLLELQIRGGQKVKTQVHTV